MISIRWRLLCCFVVTTAAIVAPNSAFAQQRPGWTASKMKGTPNPPAPYAIEPAFPNLRFDHPSTIEELPNGRMLVSEIGGNIFTFDMRNRDAKQKDLVVSIDGARLWHATAHPQFSTNGQLFACYSKNGVSHVSRFQTNGTPIKSDNASEEILLTWPAGGPQCGMFAIWRRWNVVHIDGGWLWS